MGYSLSAQGPTKQAAIANALKSFAAIVEQQPIHAADAPAVEAAITAFINLLPDTFHEGEPPRDYQVTASGWLTSRFEGGIVGGNIMVTSSLTTRTIPNDPA